LDFFNKIYILNLHGNKNIQETCPDGSPDDGVFNIKQGTTIFFFIKNGKNALKEKTIQYADLFGRQDYKYNFLEENCINDISWNSWKPETPNFRFKPIERDFKSEYEMGWSLDDIFEMKKSGFNTTHDKFAIALSRSDIIRNVEQLLSTESEDEARNIFTLCKQSQWTYDWAMEILEEEDWREFVTKCAYRPFDVRWTVYHPCVLRWRREDVNDHLFYNENMALISNKDIEYGQFQHVFVSNIITDHHTVSSKEVNYVFPLYCFNKKHEKNVNYSIKFIHFIQSAYNITLTTKQEDGYCQNISAEDIFSYIYAILNHPTYRTKYSNLLTEGFPKIPFTEKIEIFKKLVKYGRELIELHLLKNIEITQSVPVLKNGSNIIEKGYPKYDEKNGFLYINKKQYFENIDSETWFYSVGRYQVLKNWLKERKGTHLGIDMLNEFIRIHCSIIETLKITSEMEQEFGNWPI